MRAYKCLDKQIFESGKYQLVPIRDEDKYDIMQWRNEQIYHLRQSEPLTVEKQDWYFENVVNKLFEDGNPPQLLFSYLENGICIGYGGLVHIDWISKNAEISFITQTQRTVKVSQFEIDFTNYLHLIFEVAYDCLVFTKLHTTFYDIEERQVYRRIIESIKFKKEAELKRHINVEGILRDVYIYSHFNKN